MHASVPACVEKTSPQRACCAELVCCSDPVVKSWHCHFAVSALQKWKKITLPSSTTIIAQCCQLSSITRLQSRGIRCVNIVFSSFFINSSSSRYWYLILAVDLLKRWMCREYTAFCEKWSPCAIYESANWMGAQPLVSGCSPRWCLDCNYIGRTCCWWTFRLKAVVKPRNTCFGKMNGWMDR